MKLWLAAATVPYRQGNVEVINVRDGCVNLETWQVRAECKVRQDREYEDDEVTESVELELTPQEARTLAQGLLEAAELAEKSAG